MHRLEVEPARARLPSPPPPPTFDMSCRTLVLLLLLGLLSSASGYLNKPCPKYGCPLAPPIHEPFVPAPPGYTPKCAKPGLTFCESLDQYPQQLIKFLIEKRRLDFENFLRDESSEDFNAFRQMPNYEGFGATGAGLDYEGGSDDDGQGYDYPKPKAPSPELLFALQAAESQVQLQPNASTDNRYLPASWQTSKPAALQQQQQQQQQSASSVITQQSYSYQLPSSQLRLLYPAAAHFSNANQQAGRAGWPSTAYPNPLLDFAAAAAARSRRGKRQAAGESNAVSICPTRSQFVSPRAALNNQGNWMYVVNLEEQQQKYSQLVKSEICMSESCDGLCSLPLGYTSKCQQQYVQKRLIALEGSGDRLYTDVFWFPHGCMCQVSLEY